MPGIQMVNNETLLPVVLHIDADEDQGAFLSVWVTDGTGNVIFDAYLDDEQSVEYLRDSLGNAIGKFRNLLDKTGQVE